MLGRATSRSWAVELFNDAANPVATKQERNLVYTGITRGKKLVVLIGQRKVPADCGEE